MSGFLLYGQIGGYVVAFASAVSCTVTCFWNKWSKISDTDSAGVISGFWGFSGLWFECIQTDFTAFECYLYQDTIFNFPAYINGIRAMMCIAVIFSWLGCFTSLIGMEACRVLETIPNNKRIAIQVTGALYVVAGLLTGASISWFGGRTASNYYVARAQGNTVVYTLGATFYFGIASSIISLSAGIMFLCLVRPKEEDNLSDIFDPGEFSPNSSVYRPSIARKPLTADNLDQNQSATQYV